MSDTYDPDRQDVAPYGEPYHDDPHQNQHYQNQQYENQQYENQHYPNEPYANEPYQDEHYHQDPQPAPAVAPPASGGRGSYQYEAYTQPGAPRRSGAHSRRPPPRPPRPARQPRRGRGSRTHHPVVVGVALVVGVIVIAAAIFAYWVKKQVNPGGKPGAVVTVVIPKGASASKIGSVLDADGIIHSGSLFPYYVRIKGSGTLYPGTYRLAKNESYSKVIAALQKGPAIVVDRLVVPEGFTVAQIAVAVGKLPDAGITAAQFLAAADGGQVRSPFEPKGTLSLEGLLFPATYQVQASQSPVSLVQQMVDAFDQNATSLGLAAGAAKLKMSPYQVVTVASMVEREASRAQDRGPVASVIYNRLHQNIALGIDSTLLYGLHTTNANVNPETPNPYNTRINKGLPPTPIANPGVASLQAALDPPTTTYLYYAVTGPGGQTSFATTAAQFAQIQAECQQRGYCS